MCKTFGIFYYLLAEVSCVARDDAFRLYKVETLQPLQKYNLKTQFI